MFSFRPFALVLAVSLCAAHVLTAQSSNSSSDSANQPQQQDQTQPATTGQSSSSQASASQSSSNQGPLTVQARIRARREQRRAQAIHDVYSHLYEAYAGMGYLRFTPGPNLQRVTDYAWNAGFTRYYGERLGATLDARGYYGTAYVGLNFSGVTRPAISTYTFMAGPTYRFYIQPKYSISGRVLGGVAMGNFSSDTSGFGSTALGMYPDSTTYAVNGGLLGEYNLSPAIGFRLAGDYLGTGFGSTLQNSFGFTGSIVYRFGKQ
jgi:hypothetical protein